MKIYNIKKYTIITSIILVIISTIIIYINYHNKIQKDNISNIYYNLIIAIQKKEKKSINFYSNEIIKNHKNSIQYDLSCLIQAKKNIKENNLNNAKKYLKLIIENYNSNLYDIANIRIIKILIEKKKYKKALLLIKKKKNIIYKPFYKELKGDIFLKINKKKDATEVYRKSYNMNKNNILKYKMLSNKN